MNEHGLPRWEHEAARRITELEHRAPPDVMMWKPASSASGKWEAMGDGWVIEEADPSRFCDALEARLGRPHAEEPR